MWGRCRCITSSRRCIVGAAGLRAAVKAVKCRIELPSHLAERRVERRAAPDQHVIVAVAKAGTLRQPHHLAQPPPHSVALHGIADLPRHRKADAHRAVFGAAPRLQHERRPRRP